MNKVLELFGESTSDQGADWIAVSSAQRCPYLSRKCLKIRKSRPSVSIGTCSVGYGEDNAPVIICPHRLLERNQIFTDCVHLLALHEPGNELHVVREITLPGGSIDYVLVSVRNAKVRDFVGIELQTLDTTGTVWPERQRFLKTVGVKVATRDMESSRGFGMNWKMTAKTTLVQLHHKVKSFEHISKRLVLVLQDRLLAYMRGQFSFGHLTPARTGDSVHFHAYSLAGNRGQFRIELGERVSTDANGIAACLGLQADARVELDEIIRSIESRISPATQLNIAMPSIGRKRR